MDKFIKTILTIFFKCHDCFFFLYFFKNNFQLHGASVQFEPSWKEDWSTLISRTLQKEVPYRQFSTIQWHAVDPQAERSNGVQFFFPFWMLNVIIIKKSFDVYYNYTLHTIHMHSTAYGESCVQLYYLCGVSMSFNLFQFPLGDFSFVGIQFRQSGDEKVIINKMKKKNSTKLTSLREGFNDILHMHIFELHNPHTHIYIYSSQMFSIDLLSHVTILNATLMLMFIRLKQWQ